MFVYLKSNKLTQKKKIEIDKVLLKWSTMQDKSKSPLLSRRRESISFPLLAALAFSLAFLRWCNLMQLLANVVIIAI